MHKTTLDCLLKEANDYIYKLSKILYECYAECPEECDSISYRTSQSFLGAKTNFDSPLLSDDIKFDGMDIVFIYYPKLEYTVIDQMPKMNFFDLISSAGGILGLFIGVSFFTLVEVLENILELACGSLLTKKPRSVHIIEVKPKSKSPNEMQIIDRLKSVTSIFFKSYVN